jgi:hypothetical protein
MKGRIASSMNFLINPNMDQEASDISNHIIEVFQRATGPNNNLIKASILIPGDESGSVFLPSTPGDEQNDQQVEFEYTEPQHDLVTRLSKLEEKFQAFERMDKKLTLIGGSVDTLNSSISNLTSSGPKSDTATTEESTIDHTLIEDILKSTIQQIETMTSQQSRLNADDDVKSIVKTEITEMVLPRLAELNKLVGAISLADRSEGERAHGAAITEEVISQITNMILPRITKLDSAVARITSDDAAASRDQSNDTEDTFVSEFSNKLLDGINPTIQSAVAATIQDATSLLLRVQTQVNTRPSLDIAREVMKLIQPTLSSIREGIVRIATSSELQVDGPPGTVLGDSTRALTSTYNELLEMKRALQSLEAKAAACHKVISDTALIMQTSFNRQVRMETETEQTVKSCCRRLEGATSNLKAILRGVNEFGKVEAEQVVKMIEYIEENTKLQREFEVQFGLNTPSNEVDLTQNSDEEKKKLGDNEKAGGMSTPPPKSGQNLVSTKVSATPHGLSEFKTPRGSPPTSPANTYYSSGRAIYGNEYNDGPGVDPTESVIDEAFQRKTPPELMFPEAKCEAAQLPSEPDDAEEDSVQTEVDNRGDEERRRAPATAKKPARRWADEDSDSSEERAVLDLYPPISSHPVDYEDMDMPTAVGEIITDRHPEMSNLTMPGDIGTQSTTSNMEPANLESSFQVAGSKTTGLDELKETAVEPQTPARRIQPSRSGKKAPAPTTVNTPSPASTLQETPAAPQPKRKISDHFGKKTSSTGKKKNE